MSISHNFWLGDCKSQHGKSADPLKIMMNLLCQHFAWLNPQRPIDWFEQFTTNYSRCKLVKLKSHWLCLSRSFNALRFCFVRKKICILLEWTEIITLGLLYYTVSVMFLASDNRAPSMAVCARSKCSEKSWKTLNFILRSISHSEQVGNWRQTVNGEHELKLLSLIIFHIWHCYLLVHRSFTQIRVSAATGLVFVSIWGTIQFVVDSLRFYLGLCLTVSEDTKNIFSSFSSGQHIPCSIQPT